MIEELGNKDKGQITAIQELEPELPATRKEKSEK